MSLVVFVEEASMEATLNELIPKLELDGSQIQIVTHQGKTDLDASWRRKLPVWNTPNTRFLILRDNDGGDCIALKTSLEEVAENCGKADIATVRIVCQELEAWFLGDRMALVKAGYINEKRNPRELRDPDSHAKPSEILSRWKKGRQKVAGAREIAKHMDPIENTSVSFGHAINSIRSEI